MDEWVGIFELLSYVVATIGFPFAIATYIVQKKKDRAFEEESTFHHLDESYISFQQLCLEHPDLDIFDPPFGEAYEPSEEQLRRESAIFAIQISMFERAFVMFRNKSEEFRASQWSGWVEYIKSYCGRANFVREWEKIGPQFDCDFHRFMNTLIEESRA